MMSSQFAWQPARVWHKRVKPRAARELVHDRVVVEHVAVDLAEGGRAAGQPEAPRGVLLAQDPAHAVEVVDQRLGHVIAREPAEVVPVAELVLELAELRSRPTAVGRAEEHGLDGHDVADRAVVDPLDLLLVGEAVAALVAGHDGDVLLLGHVAQRVSAAGSRPGRWRAASR